MRYLPPFALLAVACTSVADIELDDTDAPVDVDTTLELDDTDTGIDTELDNCAPVGVAVGQCPADLHLLDQYGDVVVLSSFRGKPVVLLTCPLWGAPCIDAALDLVQLEELVTPLWVITENSFGELPEPVDAVVAATGLDLTYSIGVDLNGDIGELYGSDAYRVLDSTGRVSWEGSPVDLLQAALDVL